MKAKLSELESQAKTMNKRVVQALESKLATLQDQLDAEAKWVKAEGYNLEQGCRRIFVYTFRLINICLSLPDDANKILTLNIERA